MKKGIAILLTLFTFLPLCSCETTDVNSLSQEEQTDYLNNALEKTSNNYTCVVKESATIKINNEKTYVTSKYTMKANKKRMHIKPSNGNINTISVYEQFYAFKDNEIHQYIKNADKEWGKAVINYDFFYATQIPNLNVNTNNVFTYENHLFNADTSKLNKDLLNVVKTIYNNTYITVMSAAFEYYYIVCKNNKVESINCSYTINAINGYNTMRISTIVSFTYSKVGTTLVLKPFGLAL